MFAKEVYVNRRKKLKEAVGSGVILFLGNDEVGSNFEDNVYPFRQDSTFAYFFGISMPGLSAVIDIDGNTEKLYGPALSIDHVIFSGSHQSLEDKAASVGVRHVADSANLQGDLKEALQRKNKIHYLPPYRSEHRLKLARLLEIPLEEIEGKVSIDLIKAIVALRSIKSADELAEIEGAIATTVEMQKKAMEMARPGITERDLYAEVERIALTHGAGTSFPTIMTVNGQILHNHYRGNELKSGDMVLCDCGAEAHSGYAGDLTRTFPVDKKFTTRQKQVYDIVYAAYKTAKEMLRPGIEFYKVHWAACVKIVEGLKELGLMKGDPDEAVSAGAHTLFFQCGLGHMLGMDVHDMENLGEAYVGYTDELRQSTEFGFKSLRLGRILQEGMVLTVEPGIYLIPELIDLRKGQKAYLDFVDYESLEAYRHFGGIRIEDVFYITSDGAQLLGPGLPTTSGEIEAFRQSAGS
ncbi:aminopeptidase P family protein [Pseudozobellia thermophila]|uniref:Xaa-Pro aminopeptidase n=1 Tax=Pseudozobellia thermophila TaxID=192903 RepID=A0A1M6GBM9_9FLAO|nr:aminopeptidase P family protein [Pseudozobellia thermophila]SHJ07307.1 Xaa-Pro aminopeptidase [Pseudozobellia thermophila]